MKVERLESGMSPRNTVYEAGYSKIGLSPSLFAILFGDLIDPTDFEKTLSRLKKISSLGGDKNNSLPEDFEYFSKEGRFLMPELKKPYIKEKFGTEYISISDMRMILAKNKLKLFTANSIIKEIFVPLTFSHNLNHSVSKKRVFIKQMNLLKKMIKDVSDQHDQ